MARNNKFDDEGFEQTNRQAKRAAEKNRSRARANDRTIVHETAIQKTIPDNVHELNSSATPAEIPVAETAPKVEAVTATHPVEVKMAFPDAKPDFQLPDNWYNLTKDEKLAHYNALGETERRQAKLAMSKNGDPLLESISRLENPQAHVAGDAFIAEGNNPLEVKAADTVVTDTTKTVEENLTKDVVNTTATDSRKIYEYIYKDAEGAISKSRIAGSVGIAILAGVGGYKLFHKKDPEPQVKNWTAAVADTRGGAIAR